MSITVKELYDATIAGTSALAKHARENPDMPVFLLLGQDMHAWQLVEKWIIWSNTGAPTIDIDSKVAKKIGEARVICDQMQRWPLHKAPD